MLSTMKKYIVTILTVTSFFLLFGQEELKDIDTILDYRERFYPNGQLEVENSLLNINSNESSASNDSSQLQYVKHGLWIEYFDKKWNECDSSEHHYFRLGEYDSGYFTGKTYDFTKNKEIVRTYLRYPKIKDTIFEGVREIKYEDGKIAKIEYHLFNQDQSQLFFWHYSYYNKNGVLTSYSYTNEAQNLTRFITYSKDGQVIKDYKRDEIEWYDKKWNKRRTRLKEEVYLKGKKIVRVYKNNKLVKEKVK